VDEDIQQRAKVRVFGIGLEAYWDRFEGLRDRLEGYQRSVEERIVLAAEGESLPGQTLKIGKTNSRLRFTLPPAAFMNAWCEQGPTHHPALGHHAGTLRKGPRLLDLEFVEVGRS
jgi:L-arabinose isomerase